MTTEWKACPAFDNAEEALALQPDDAALKYELRFK